MFSVLELNLAFAIISTRQASAKEIILMLEIARVIDNALGDAPSPDTYAIEYRQLQSPRQLVGQHHGSSPLGSPGAKPTTQLTPRWQELSAEIDELDVATQPQPASVYKAAARLDKAVAWPHVNRKLFTQQMPSPFDLVVQNIRQHRT